jgi:hypothetical protein
MFSVVIERVILVVGCGTAIPKRLAVFRATTRGHPGPVGRGMAGASEHRL